MPGRHPPPKATTIPTSTHSRGNRRRAATATLPTLAAGSSHGPTDPAAHSRGETTLAAETAHTRPRRLSRTRAHVGVVSTRPTEATAVSSPCPTPRHPVARRPKSNHHAPDLRTAASRPSTYRDTHHATAAPKGGGPAAVWRSAPPRPLLSQPFAEAAGDLNASPDDTRQCPGRTDAQLLYTHQPACDDIDGDDQDFRIIGAALTRLFLQE